VYNRKRRRKIKRRGRDGQRKNATKEYRDES
jgi:hypothetical protein